MRGALGRVRSIDRTIGIIPAYAGSTNDIVNAISTVGDHPRVCGEHEQMYNVMNKNPGSSPRMRGAQLGIHLGAIENGIIPAYAGSTYGN